MATAQRIHRVKNTQAIDYVSEQLVVGDDFVDRQGLVDELKRLLTEYPERTFFLVSMNEDKSKINAFLLAFCAHSRPHATVFQTWADPLLNDQKILDEMMLRLMFWCEQNDILEVRMCTDRSLTRESWGFKTLTTNLTATVDESITSLVLSIKEGVESNVGTNGIRSGSTESVH